MSNLKKRISAGVVASGIFFTLWPLNFSLFNTKVYADSKSEAPYLKSIYLSEGDNIDFKENVYEYIVDVDQDIEEIFLRARPQNDSYIVKVNGTIVEKDNRYKYESKLNEGKNKFIIEVLDSEGNESSTYTVYVYRGGEKAVYLKNITIDGSNIGFSKDIKSYNIELDDDEKSIRLKIDTEDENYTVSIKDKVLTNSNNVAKLSFSQNIGKYVFNIDVKDNETGRSTSYEINIYLGIPVTPNIADSINQVLKPNQWVIVNGRWQYNDALGNPIKNNWFYDSNYNGFYHFNSKGNMQTGWSIIDDKTYYLGPDGKMRTGWVDYEGEWYYLDLNGVMKTGWNFIDYNWYYLNGDGSMYTGWLPYKGKWYFLSANGKMKTGWILYNKKWYYLTYDGSMKTGWQYYDNNWYYLNNDGSMRTGEWVFYNSNWYYINYSGTMRYGWLYKDDKYYYFNEDGTMNKSSKVIDGYLYNFNNDGSVNFG